MLCEVCSRICSSGVDRGDHHTSLGSFTKAAASGCYICTPLLKHARKKTDYLEDSGIGRCEYSLYGFYESSAERYRQIQIRMHMKNRNPVEYVQDFVAIRTSSLPVRTGIYDRRSTILMAECLPAAQKWMNICVDKHEKCQQHTQPHKYPTRLLELGSHKARLIVPREDIPSGPYAALSYCWGPNPSFIRLTADNLQEFRLGLPYSSLSIAFQEAIQLIEGLGIRYLWIDALCIIQSGFGSSEDWQSECGRMQDVYSNCIINLSLAQAAHPNQSCLGGYNFDSTLPFEANVVDTPCDHGPRETHTYTVLSDDYFKKALYDQPIGRRAWVMQERLLATRVLSIGHGELFWDCQQVPHASETLPDGFAFCSDFMRKNLNNDVGLSIHSIPRISDWRDLDEIWAKILIEYTARELTYPQLDKLVALSAISRRMGYAMKDMYLVGHFLQTLPESLNWSTYRDCLPALRAGERVTQRLPKFLSQMLDENWVITPSWSWASMDGPLNMKMAYGQTLLFVAAVEAYKLFPIGQKGSESHVENVFLLTIRTWCRFFEWKPVLPSIINELEITLGGDSAIHLMMDDMRDLPEDGNECLLAILGHTRYVLEGLLLKKIDFYGNKVYERIGHFTCPISGSERILGDWRKLFMHGERSITLC